MENFIPINPLTATAHMSMSNKNPDFYVYCQKTFYDFYFVCTVELANKELFGRPKIVP